jgi:NDP-sugar pyrophosphorylase family protein
VDILSTIDLQRMLEVHNEKKALATLAVQQRDSSRLLIFDENLRLCGRRAGRDREPEIVCPSANLQPRAFCGVHVISPRLLRMMQEEGVFSIIDSYLRLAARGENILGFPADEYYWRDLGKLEDLAQAKQDIVAGTLI